MMGLEEKDNLWTFFLVFSLCLPEGQNEKNDTFYLRFLTIWPERFFFSFFPQPYLHLNSKVVLPANVFFSFFPPRLTFFSCFSTLAREPPQSQKTVKKRKVKKRKKNLYTFFLLRESLYKQAKHIGKYSF